MKRFALSLIVVLSFPSLPHPPYLPHLPIVSAQAPVPPPGSRAPLWGYQIIRAYPHDTQAFTEGLEYRDGFLYESTGLNGKSSIRKVKIETGEVVQQRNISRNYFGEGITFWKD